MTLPHGLDSSALRRGRTTFKPDERSDVIMDDEDLGPDLDTFLRHLQFEIDQATEIQDRIEREQRMWQLEAAFLEARRFLDRYQARQAMGEEILTVRSTRPRATEDFEGARASEASSIGGDRCVKCSSALDPDLDFCWNCGAKVD